MLTSRLRRFVRAGLLSGALVMATFGVTYAAPAHATTTYSPVQVQKGYHRDREEFNGNPTKDVTEDATETGC